MLVTVSNQCLQLSNGAWTQESGLPCLDRHMRWSFLVGTQGNISEGWDALAALTGLQELNMVNSSGMVGSLAGADSPGICSLVRCNPPHTSPIIAAPYRPCSCWHA